MYIYIFSFFDFSASVKCMFKDCELPATTTPADFGGMYRSLNLNYVLLEAYLQKKYSRIIPNL